MTHGSAAARGILLLVSLACSLSPAAQTVNNSARTAFIDKMVAQHGFDRAALKSGDVRTLPAIRRLDSPKAVVEEHLAVHGLMSSRPARRCPTDFPGLWMSNSRRLGTRG